MSLRTLAHALEAEALVEGLLLGEAAAVVGDGDEDSPSVTPTLPARWWHQHACGRC